MQVDNFTILLSKNYYYQNQWLSDFTDINFRAAVDTDNVQKTL